jgi:hypothetical protein
MSRVCGIAVIAGAAISATEADAQQAPWPPRCLDRENTFAFLLGLDSLA